MLATRFVRLIAALALPLAFLALPSTAVAQPGKGEIKDKVKEKTKERVKERQNDRTEKSDQGEKGDKEAQGLRGELMQRYKTELREHPRMARALVDLALAKEHLQKAAHDFGGHRVEAVRAIDEAIKQIELAIKYDAKYEGKGDDERPTPKPEPKDSPKIDPPGKK